MNAHEDPKLPQDDASFVRRVAEVYARQPMTAASRTRFDARLAERIERRRGRRTRGLAAAAAAAATAAAIALAWVAPQQRTVPVAEGRGGGEVILALALAPASDLDADLPDDYRAISALLAE